MRPLALLQYDPELVAVSIVVAVVLAFVLAQHPLPSYAIVPLGGNHHRQHQSCGCAIAGMHYTAMQASIFFPLPDAPAYSIASSPTLLALLITIFAVLIAVSTLVAAFAGRQTSWR